MRQGAPNDVGRAQVGWMMGGAAIARGRQAAEQTRDEQQPMQVLSEIRRATMDELAKCRIIAEAMEGRSAERDYIAYLTNVYHYARFSPVIMAAAAARCCQTHEKLARYLLKHAAEEQGHERWALDDLSKLGVAPEFVERTRPTAACAALVGYVHDQAAFRNPVAIMGWMYVLEAVGADIGTAVGEKLGQAHGDKSNPIRFVAGHGEADASHAVAINQTIENYVLTPEDRRDVCETARVVSYLYTTMFRQIGDERATWVSS